ncbi:Plasmodium exported protein, unknown function [Plasmodium vivax]|uniref:Pv-fam-d protein n=2 Tax=Plasmodium vivax TaxID=5855 RepID=A0A1G4HLD0_PLAVI|nr:Plasmodium exported protein, unknown function [Plasmodium vivax]
MFLIKKAFTLALTIGTFIGLDESKTFIKSLNKESTSNNSLNGKSGRILHGGVYLGRQQKYRDLTKRTISNIDENDSIFGYSLYSLADSDFSQKRFNSLKKGKKSPKRSRLYSIIYDSEENMNSSKFSNNSDEFYDDIESNYDNKSVSDYEEEYDTDFEEKSDRVSDKKYKSLISDFKAKNRSKSGSQGLFKKLDSKFESELMRLLLFKEYHDERLLNDKGLWAYVKYFISKHRVILPLAIAINLFLYSSLYLSFTGGLILPFWTNTLLAVGVILIIMSFYYIHKTKSVKRYIKKLMNHKKY